MLITSDVMKKLTRQQVAHTLSAVQKKEAVEEGSKRRKPEDSCA